MQLAKKDQNLTTGGGVLNTTQLKIAMNAKMFDVLSNSMYEDKIGSIIREVSSNALDGHIKAGCPEKPFTIHVPNAIEPWFSVKDEGVGMSDEDIQTVYSTYGESTKDQSNDEIGAFGLGSKTPFSYTDQFTVISIHANVKRTYSAFRGNDGLPVINLLAEEPTTEHSGVEVHMAVNKEDFNEFKQKIIRQLKFFAVKPTLVNNMDDITFPAMDEGITYESDLVTVYSGKSSSWGGNIPDPIQDLWLIQGGVSYKLNLEYLNLKNNEVKSFAHALENQNAFIRFPIGDISVTANREAIAYEPHTVDSITRRLTQIAQEMTSEVHKELKAEKSLWQRIAIYNKQMDVMQRAIKNLPDFATLFDGADYSRSRMVFSVTPLDTEGFRAVQMAKYEYRPRGTYGTYITKVKRKVVGTDTGRYGEQVTLEPLDNMRVFIRDTGSKPMARIQMLCDDEDYPAILVVESKVGSDIDHKYIRKIAKLLHMPVSRIEKLSDLPAPKVTRTGKPADKRPRAFKFDGHKVTDSSRDWEPLFDDIDDIGPAIYIPMDRHTLVGDTTRDMAYKRVRFMLVASNQGMFDMPVIAVNNQTRQRIEDGKIGAELVWWDDAVEKLLDKLKASVSTFTSIKKYEGFKQGLGHYSIVQKLWAMDSLDTTALPTIEKIGAVSRRVDQLTDRLGGDPMNIMGNYHDLLGLDSDDLSAIYKDGVAKGQRRVQAFMDKYPMIKYLGSYPNEDNLKDAIEYIKMVDGA